MSSKLSSERGAMLIQVALASVVLLAFSMFVIDYGVMWVSRGQAQNSADSGAMAGAVALAFDDFSNRVDSGPAKQAALRFALLNRVFGEAPDVQVNTDVIFYDDDPMKFPAECADDSCIRVDVYRNQARANPLPMIFGQLVRLTEQGVRAMAIARVAPGNATDCLKPWAIMDRWEEHWEGSAPAVAPYSATSRFDKYDSAGVPDPGVLVPDVYAPPSTVYDEGDVVSHDFGTGLHPFNSDHSYNTEDYGRPFVIETGPMVGFEWGSGRFVALNIGDFEATSVGCVGVTYRIGDELEIEPADMSEPTADAAASLIGEDPGASWDASIGPLGPMGLPLGGVAGSAFDTSPRIVAIPFVSPDLLAEVLTGSRTTVPIANIGGFFIESVGGPPGREVTGRLVTLPGLIDEGGGGAAPSSFLVNISLIR